MYAWLHSGRFARLGAFVGPRETAASPSSERSAWAALPLAAQVYIAGVIAAGGYVMAAFFPLTYPRPFLFAALLVVACLTSILEGEAGAVGQERVDALGLVRVGADGAAAAGTSRGDGDRRRRRLDPVHVPRRSPLSGALHDLQHGCRSDHDPGHRPGLRVAGRAGGAAVVLESAAAARRRDRGALLRQHRPRRRRDRALGTPAAVEGLARQLSVERSQLRGGRGRRRRRGRGHRARPVCGGDSAARAGLPDLSHLPGLPRPSRRSEAACRRNPKAPPRGDRGAGAGQAGRTRAGG